ncbi:MAG: S8 family serine peptidase [Verrucomicrobiota bacterium]
MIGFSILFLFIQVLSPAAETVRFQFREPQAKAYQIEKPVLTALVSTTNSVWLKGWPETDPAQSLELGNRLVLQLQQPDQLSQILAEHSLAVARVVAETVFILQAPNAWMAAQAAQVLAGRPEVLAGYPVMRRQVELNGAYAFKPNDPYFYVQWYLEHRDAQAIKYGPDLNVRAAWPLTRGQGVTVAVADLGVQLNHPDLTSRTLGAPHFNFFDHTTNGNPAIATGPTSGSWAHGTEVAGLIAAEGNNRAGMVGVAPEAQLASWVISATNGMLVGEEELMDMYQFSSNVVSIQNHSWGRRTATLNEVSLLEQIGLSNAIALGRGGRGVVMLRSAGNNRQKNENANDDGYAIDPRVIAVGAVRPDGRVSSFSVPGSCILVAAPNGDEDLPGLFTTDLTGPAAGVNQINFPTDPTLSDYAFNAFGLWGNSASAPQVSGVAALILSANGNLTYRDVQQILIHSARHFDLTDPDLSTNAAGFRVSHNLGFGVPDAGRAVALARSWPNRPPLRAVTITATNRAAIPDDGLRLLINGAGVPAPLVSIRSLPTLGPHADEPTAILPLVDVGLATNQLAVDLHGKAALIQRGGQYGKTNYAEKIEIAAQAGAAFAVVYNNSAGNENCPGGDALCPMGGTDFVPIPAVFIGQSDGEALRALLQQQVDVRGQIRLTSTHYSFAITNTLLCEHVGLRVKTDHPLRGDLRMTLVSPQGTRSILQRFNSDTNAGPSDWTYYSTHHFYESSAGTWTFDISDEYAGATGSVLEASLILRGVDIMDADQDGLDDAWEMQHFNSLSYGPLDDPDADGYQNAREQIMGADPLAADVPFQLDLSRWDERLARLSWPSTTNRVYEVWTGTNAAVPLALVTNLPGQFPETEWFTPYANPARQFFRVLAK